MACRLSGAKPLSKPMLAYYINWTIGNKLQWNLNWNLHVFIQENGYENVVRKYSAILSRPQCVNFISNKYTATTQAHLETFRNMSLLISISQRHWTCRIGVWRRIDLLALVNWVITGSSNGLTPVWCQAITWTNDKFLSIGVANKLRCNFS